jgi:hypothetical protein
MPKAESYGWYKSLIFSCLRREERYGAGPNSMIWLSSTESGGFQPPTLTASPARILFMIFAVKLLIRLFLFALVTNSDLR